MNANDGTVIVRSTNQLSDLYMEWNQTVHDMRTYSSNSTPICLLLINFIFHDSPFFYVCAFCHLLQSQRIYFISPFFHSHSLILIYFFSRCRYSSFFMGISITLGACDFQFLFLLFPLLIYYSQLVTVARS